MTPSVQAIILNWNGWRDTLECVRSLHRQAGVAPEILVADNGSSGDSVARLRALEPALDVLENGGNLGFSGGINAALRSVLRHKRPDAFWLLNNDTVVEPETLARMCACLAADQGVGAVGSVICEANPPHHLQAWGGGWISPGLGIPRVCRGPRYRYNYLCGASILLRTAALQQVGWLDEGFFFYFEDADYCFRLRRSGWRLDVAPEARVLHKGGGSVGRQSETSARLYRSSLIRFLRKHSRSPVFPALFSTAFRLAAAGLKGQSGVLRGTLSGWRDGWRAAC